MELRRFLLWLVFAMPIALPAGSASATVIGFDDLPNGTVVTTQYPSATFSSIPGEDLVIDNSYDFGAPSYPNYICTAGVQSSIDCTNPVYVDFTSPVNNLTFQALGDNSPGVQAQVDVFQGGVYSATVPISVNGDFNTPLLVDLSAYGNVTRIAIHDVTDPAGLAWDTFSFNPVPEPSTFALLVAAAVGLAGGAWRRRRRLVF